MQKNKPPLAPDLFCEISHPTPHISSALTSLWLPFLSGILLTLTLPTFGFWPLVWVALVPFFIFASTKTLPPARLLVGALFFALPYVLAVTYPLLRVTSWWWVSGIMSFETKAGELHFALIILLLACFSALFFLPNAFVLRRFGLTPQGGIIVAFFWVFCEWIRSSYGLFGYSWGVLGYTLLDTRYVKYIAQLHVTFPFIDGVYALSFLVVLGNISLTVLAHLFIKQQGAFRSRSTSTLQLLIEKPRTARTVWVFVFCFVGALFVGVSRDLFTASSVCPNPPLRVAVVSSTLSTGESIGGSAYRTYRAKINHAIAEGALLVVTPENTFPFFEIDEVKNTLSKQGIIQIAEGDDLYADFILLTKTHPDVTFAMGLHTTNESTHYNSLVLFQNGSPRAYYHKRKLVPFTEYVPFGFPLELFESFGAGFSEQYFSIDGHKATALICSEVSDTTLSTEGASIILSPSNDSVFAFDAAGIVHHQMARMRALETDAYLLRASKGGISSIIDPMGNVLAAGHDGVFIADVCLAR